MTMIVAQQTGFNVLQSLQNAFTTLVNYLPQIIGALLVLAIGYIIARLLKAGITKLLNRFRVDDRLTSGQGGQYVQRFSPRGSPSRLAGTVVFAVLMLFVVASAIGTLGIPALTGFMNLVLGYLPRIIAALLILAVATAIAGAIGGIAHRGMGDTPTGRVVRTAAPALVMAIAVFMVLTQLRIAPVIVTATYIALIGALALGAALAFGLGGREAAADMINAGYRRAQEEQETVRRDMQTGRERARSQTQNWSMQEAGAGGGTSGSEGTTERSMSSPASPQQGGEPGSERGGSHRAT
ncbi:mechanosensitive ion channel family protein [Haloactinomyces albus]|uniref:Uncharacterized protein YacL n=1 Tax=Haloactinomyces albus TaxID=1352928 RepID=A0AAE3Z7Y2_9ACTN|nr:hypothetical protein [Haloactinomyces albus]MDR7299991.1 uncharacterized protein YacL [Haloactinomyces albus]